LTSPIDSLQRQNARTNPRQFGAWWCLVALTQHSNQVSTNTGLCRGETRFCRAETKAPKRLLKSNQQPAEAKCALLTKDEARRIAANVAKLPERKD
jgi:hypothetical protein